MSRPMKTQPRTDHAAVRIKSRSFIGFSVYGQQAGGHGNFDVAELTLGEGLVLIHKDDLDAALSLARQEARQEARQQLLQELEQTLGAIAQGGDSVRS